MQRLLSLFLLICFGVIAPVQGMPLRVCLLESSAQTVAETSFGEMRECCLTCENTPWSAHRSDCCVDVDHQSESTVPRVAQSETVLELPVMILLTSQWIELLRPLVATPVSYPIVWDALVPSSGSERQAVLSIWTV